MTNYYHILGLQNFASLDEIKAAYKQKIKRYHPDISEEPNAEEMTKILNLVKSQLDTAEAKYSYDNKLRRAFERNRHTRTKLYDKNSKTNKRGRNALSKDEIKQRQKQAAVAKKKAIKHRYENHLTYFPKAARTAAIALVILFGFQLIHSHFHFYYGSPDRILFTLGIGILFCGFAAGANEFYTRMIIRSISERIAYSFEKRIAWLLVGGYISSLIFVFIFNKIQTNYLLENNYNYVTAKVINKMSHYGNTVVWYEVDNKEYYKALDAYLYELPKISKGIILLRYANPNPLICEAVELTELDAKPPKTAR